jgi:hypothetical protein
MSPTDEPLVWLHGEIKTPPFSSAARLEAGVLLRRLQKGEMLSLPYSRPMPSVGAHCHELRIPDEQKTWRILYRSRCYRHRRGLPEDDGQHADSCDRDLQTAAAPIGRTQRRKLA